MEWGSNARACGWLWRSRWAAIGAAVAVTLGAGGLMGVNAASPQSVFVAVSPTRVLDTRIDVGLTDAFGDGVARKLDVTGTVPVVLPGNVPGTGAPVPDGATAIVANVTVVAPTTAGFVAVRPGNATGEPTTSNLNFTSPGAVIPNSVTVELAGDGAIDLFFRGTAGTATADLLVDIVGYYVAGGQGVPGPKGDTGDAGPAGAAGATGPRGLSAWDTIPSGVTVTGVVEWNEIGPAASEFSFSIDLPAVAPADLSFAAVNFAADASAVTIDDNAACTGSSAVPTAPPGNVCIYTEIVTGVAEIQGTEHFVLLDHGFVILGTHDGTEDAYVNVSWAYTAP